MVNVTVRLCLSYLYISNSVRILFLRPFPRGVWRYLVIDGQNKFPRFLCNIKRRHRIWNLSVLNHVIIMSILLGSTVVLFKAFLCGLFVSLLVFFITKFLVRIKPVPSIIICITFFFLYLFQFTLWFGALKTEEYIETIWEQTSNTNLMKTFEDNPWIEHFFPEMDTTIISKIQSLQEEINSYKTRRILWFTIFFIGEILLCFLFRENQARNFVQPTYNNDYTQRKVKF